LGAFDFFYLESSDRVSGVGDSADESVRVDDAVAALDLVSLALLLPVLVVGEKIVFHVEREVVGRVGLLNASEQFSQKYQ